MIRVANKTLGKRGSIKYDIEITGSPFGKKIQSNLTRTKGEWWGDSGERGFQELL